ncbi:MULTISPECIES: hypothetical protein [Roseivirga]|nr:MULTISPECIES: hypothetical protein [Roseivirga]WPZ10888.1 hypothetical protein T7867_02100 [Roseivirga spongicola]
MEDGRRKPGVGRMKLEARSQESGVRSQESGAENNQWSPIVGK